jgi:hypothetical protein
MHSDFSTYPSNFPIPVTILQMGFNDIYCQHSLSAARWSANDRISTTKNQSLEKFYVLRQIDEPICLFN